MKRWLLAGALLGLEDASQAQSSLTMYGLLDTAVERVNGVGVKGQGLTRIPSAAGAVPSRWGLRGREDLGGGVSAQWVLEMGLAPASGAPNQGGRAFGRQAFVALNGPWGQWGLGRQYTMLFWSLQEADVIGPGIHSIANFDSYFPNARADNALSYKGRFSGWTLGATYSFGRDAVHAGPIPSGTHCPGATLSDRHACREWSTLLRYDSADGGLTLARDVIRGGPGAFAGLDHGGRSDSRAMLNGYLRFNRLKLGAGLMQRNNGGHEALRHSELRWIGVSGAWQAWAFEAQHYQFKYRAQPQKSDFLVLRATRHLSRRTAVYASWSHMRNSPHTVFGASSGGPDGLPAPGGRQTGLGLGVRHSF